MRTACLGLEPITGLPLVDQRRISFGLLIKQGGGSEVTVVGINKGFLRVRCSLKKKKNSSEPDPRNEYLHKPARHLKINWSAAV